MGGLLAAEVASILPERGSGGYRRHRLLGTINFDTPFLGMHPGIIMSGISSPFRSAPEPTATQESTALPQDIDSPRHNSETGLSSYGLTPTSSGNSIAEHHAAGRSGSSSSPYAHENDDSLQGTSVSSQSSWSRAFYFINKHYSDGLTKAVKDYLASHIEFGKCLADHTGLMNRYTQIRDLENDRKWRTRFANYYTASSGRPKAKRKDMAAKGLENDVEHSRSSSSTALVEQDLQSLAISKSIDGNTDPIPAISSEAGDHDTSTNDEALQQPAASDKPAGLYSNGTQEESKAVSTDLPSIYVHPSTSDLSSTITPYPEPDQELNTNQISTDDLPASNLLPPIPDRPPSPAAFDPSIYPDKATLKLASRAHDRDVKIYKRLLKARDDAITDRRKMLVKQAKKTLKKQKSKPSHPERSPAVEHLNENLRDVERPKLSAASPPLSSSTSLHTTDQKPDSVPKQQKLHTFCLLPSKPDPCWVRVVMRDMDEVTAHCALFAADGQHYRDFARDVVERIQEWVEEKEESES
ncbi:MAG: hypothetical protein Q9220_001864 [cf. Caloplaca sp. 1 TL-2023]